MLISTAILSLAISTSAAASGDNYRGLVAVKSDGSIVGIDSSDGTVSSLGAAIAAPLEHYHASAYDPTRNRLYLGDPGGTGAGIISTLNTTTWQVDNTAVMRFASPDGFAYDTKRDRVLVCSSISEFLLWEIDPTTGAHVDTVARKSAGFGTKRAMAYVPQEDAFYVFRQSADSDELYRYDPVTDILSTVREGRYWNDSGFGEIGTLTYNPDDGYLYCIDYYHYSLGRINCLTGEVTAVSSPGTLAGMRSLEFVPEPATMGLLALGLSALLVRRRRKRRQGRA
jgi:hypothetical protein